MTTVMRMFVLFTVIILSLLLVSSYYHHLPHQLITKSIAIIYPTTGNTASGIVNFEQRENGLHITAHITGLEPGKHGLHIHEFGDCSSPDALSAGSHYNPTEKPHGSPNQHERHVGDLGNIIADKQGNAIYNRIDTQASLQGSHSVIGRSIIIHKDEDDFVSQPTGNAGARVGCGVIGIAQ